MLIFEQSQPGRSAAAQLPAACDVPDDLPPALRRDMRMSVRPVKSDGQVRHLLYQSITLRAQQRPALPLFEKPVADQDNDDILALCAICARVAWPIGAPTGEREWIEPAEYYKRDGGDVALISHGFCEDCFAQIQHED